VILTDPCNAQPMAGKKICAFINVHA
jgi:hypothetical protein